MGEEIVQSNIKAFNKFSVLYPDDEPHELLTRVWLLRMAAHGSNINDEKILLMASIQTKQFACIPSPQCAEAVGLYILYLERPDILKKYPSFGEKFKNLMVPVIEAQKNGNYETLYKCLNPKCSLRNEH